MEKAKQLKERRRTEASLVDEFMGNMKRQVLELRRSQTAFRTTPAERRALANINQFGYWQGITAGFITLIILRRGPAFSVRYLQKFMKPTQREEHSIQRVQNSPFTKSKLDFTQETKLTYYSWWIVDIILSVMSAAATSRAFTNHEAVADAIAQLPRVEGRSRITEEFCPIAISTWDHFQSEYPDVSSSPMTLYLQKIRQFTINCHRRRMMEDRIRQEYGLPSNVPVEIPSPGLPDDTKPLFENDFGSAKMSTPYEMENFYTPNYDEYSGSPKN